MRKAVAWFVGTLVAVIPAQSLCQPIDTEVRSPSGKLLYKTKTRSDTTEVRSPSGKLLLKTKQRDGSIEARSPSGKLLYRTKSK
jgi:hypothetical protein